MAGVIALDRVANHEVICAERYRGINWRLARMEALIVAALIALVGQGWMAYSMLHPPATVPVPATAILR